MCKAYGIFGPLLPSLYNELFFSFVSVGYIAESFGNYLKIKFGPNLAKARQYLEGVKKGVKIILKKY
jgi:hypothetical protein